MNVKIGLKNAVKGTYRIDDGSEFEYTGTKVISVGQGKIGNSTVKLTLTAENDKGVKTSKDFTYKKTFSIQDHILLSLGRPHKQRRRRLLRN